jgi:hypothetical protein
MTDSTPRKLQRVAVRLKAVFSIMVPEDTFQPQMYDAVVSDLSERGAMVNVGLPDDTYRQLIHKTRYCRIGLTEEDPDLPHRIIGKAVWIQRESSDVNTYRIGLYFDEVPPATVTQIRKYLERMAAQRETVPET